MQRGNYATRSWSGKPGQRPVRRRSSTGSPPSGDTGVPNGERIAAAPDAKRLSEAVQAREEARAKALIPGLRHRVFSILAVRDACVTEVAEELGENPSSVEYHFRWLAGRAPANRVPLIELVDVDTRRGGKQHFYRAIEEPRVSIEGAGALSREEREATSDCVVPKVIADLQGALKAKTMDDHPQRSLLRMHVELDEEGMLAAAELAEAHLEAIKAIARESQQRIISGSRGFAVATETLIFPVPKLYWTGA